MHNWGMYLENVLFDSGCEFVLVVVVFCDHVGDFRVAVVMLVVFGCDSGLLVSFDYMVLFVFVGGMIVCVVVDVSGDYYVDYEKEVLVYFVCD